MEKYVKKEQQHTRCNPTSGIWEFGVYAALPLPHEGGEVVSHRVKHIKTKGMQSKGKLILD